MMTPEQTTPPGWAGREALTQVVGEDLSSRPGPEDAARREAVLDVVHRYAWAYDNADVAALGMLLAPDVEWRVEVAGTASQPCRRGRETVLAWVASSIRIQVEQRRHVFANPRVFLVGSDRAEVLLTVLLYSTGCPVPVLAAAGFYRVELVLDDTRGWLMSRIVTGFDAPSGVLS